MKRRSRSFLDMLSPTSSESIMRQLPVLPLTFQSLADAAKHLRTAIYRALVLQSLDQSFDKVNLAVIRQFVNDWSIKFDHWRFAPTDSESLDKRWHLLLLAQHRMVQLLLKTMPPENDTEYSKAAIDCSIMFAQIRMFLDAWYTTAFGEGKSAEILSSFGFIPTLVFIATECRLLSVRHMALDTLRDLQAVDDQWNSYPAYAPAHTFFEMESRRSRSDDDSVPKQDLAKVVLESLNGGLYPTGDTALSIDSIANTALESHDSETYHYDADMPWVSMHGVLRAQGPDARKPFSRIVLYDGFQGQARPKGYGCEYHQTYDSSHKTQAYQTLPPQPYTNALAFLRIDSDTSDFDSTLHSNPLKDSCL